MVRRVFNLFYREVRGLHQAAYVLALFAFGSQMLALVRDRLLASHFGTGLELDLYYAAFRIPDLLFVLFASVLSVYVLIPFVTRRTEAEGSRAGADLLAQMLTLFAGSYALLALGIALAAPHLVPVLFPGLEAEQETLVLLLRILLIQPFLLGISSLFGVVTQLNHRFVIYAISPLLYNLGIIFGIVALYPALGLPGLVWGVVLGAVGHVLVQLPLVMESQWRFGFTARIDWVAIRGVFAVALPRALTLSLNQLVLLALIGTASTIAVGAVSVFQFAFNLQSVPLTIIGVSYSVAAFPALADMLARHRLDEFRAHITTALRHIIFWSVPTLVLILVLRAQIVRVLLGTGAFDWEATRLTAAVLALFALSLVAQAANLLLVRAFYAAGKTLVPLLVSLGGSVLSVVLAVGLYRAAVAKPELLVVLEALMRVTDVPGAAVLMLPLGYTLGALLQVVVLLWCVRRTFAMPLRWLAPHCTFALFAALVGGVAAYTTLNFVVAGINPDTFLGITIQGFFGGVAGLLGTGLAYYALGSQELRDAAQSFQAKLLKTDVVAPQEDVL